MEEIHNYGLIIKPAEPHHWQVGSGKATHKLGADAGEVNPSGDWSAFDSDKELQNKNGFETFNCTNFGTYLALIALSKLKGYSSFPKNCSERYSGVGTGTTPNGNDPWHVIETIATKLGAINEEVLPFSENIHGWDEYYSPDKDSKEYSDLVKIGQEVLRSTEIEPEWVLSPGNQFSPEQKRERLQEALKRGPVCVSVRAWEKNGKVYTKERGAGDTHWVWLREYDNDNPIIRDQYRPFIKKLDKDYDFNIAIVYFMRENTTKILPKDRPFALRLMRQLLSLLQRYAKMIGSWLH